MARQIVARKILEFLGEGAPSESALTKMTWCVKYANKMSSPELGCPLLFRMANLSLCDPGALCKTPSQLINLSIELAEKLDRDDLVRTCIAENNVVFFGVNSKLFIEDILRSVLQQRDAFGLQGISHRYKLNTNKAELEPLPEHERVVIEYSSPNIAKPFHAGHLRSTLLGNFLANLNASLGHRVTRINYLGDFGTQCGYLGLAYRKYGSEEELAKDPLVHLYNTYVQINKDAVDDPRIHGESVDFFSKLEQGDPDKVSLWNRLRDISVEEYNKVYKRLGVEFDVTDGESLHGEGCQRVIEEMKSKKILCYESDRNVGYVDLSDGGADSLRSKLTQAIVLRSNGTTLYLTRDIAAFLHRKERYKFDRIHYIVENGQHNHFLQLQEVLKKLDVSEKLVEGIHVKFGRIDGMSTRKGTVVFLKDILDEAKNRMMENMKAANSLFHLF